MKNNYLAGGYIFLPTYADLTDEETKTHKDTDETPVMYFAIKKDAIPTFLGQGANADSVKQFMDTFDYDESNGLYCYGLLTGGVLCTWCREREQPLKIFDCDDINGILALMDIVSGILQDAGFGDASKYLDALFEI